MTITIATWNVNSIKARLSHLVAWLREDAPHIVLLQELKCVDEAFPRMEIEELGYNIATHGQKTYNGVAILSKFPLSDITRGLPGDDTDTQARYIEAVVSIPYHPPTRLCSFGITNAVVRVASVYVPNGQDATSDKFAYKCAFLDRLAAHTNILLAYHEMLVIGGDYNIAPTDADVHFPPQWEGSVLTHDEVRTRFRKILNLGMHDAQRLVAGNQQPTANHHTWWDYRAGAFAKDDGLRIDHLLISSQAADTLLGCVVKKELRALEKASDHAPVAGIFRL